MWTVNEFLVQQVISFRLANVAQIGQGKGGMIDEEQANCLNLKKLEGRRY